MNRRNLIKTLTLGIFVEKSFGGILDAFKKSRPVNLNVYTPQNSLFIVDIKGVPSEVKNLNNYKLKIYGAIDEMLELSLNDIKSLPYVKRDVILECVSNSKGDKIGKIKVQGVSLNYILKKTGLKSTAKEVVFRAFDGYHTSIEISYIEKFDSIITYYINVDEEGQVLKEISLDHGYPLRVICPDKWGYKSIKWLKEIEVVSYDYKGYWERQGWSDRATRGIDYFEK